MISEYARMHRNAFHQLQYCSTVMNADRAFKLRLSLETTTI